MKPRSWPKFAVIFSVFCLAAVLALFSPPVPAWPRAPQEPKESAAEQQAFLQRVLDADRAFDEAAAKSDTAALDKLLDTQFTWTDFNGKTLSRREFLLQLPKPAITDPNAMMTAHNYGSLESIQVHNGLDHALHVWVNRSAGWRLIVYQEVRLLDTPPESTRGTQEACENPCKNMPYKPDTPNQRDVATGFMALQTATVAHDSKTWGRYVADEFEAANSNSNQTLTKYGRMQDLERNKMAGYRPMPVVQMRILDFGTAAILISKHQPPDASPVHITRVWVKRDGNWMEAASYQTRIEDAANAK
jgi:hypothetical protein